MRNFFLLLVLLLSISVSAQNEESIFLDFSPVAQTQPQWCWAASSSMIVNHYNDDIIDYDCQMAQFMLNKPCCQSPMVCNQQNSILAIQQAVKLYGVQSQLIHGSISWEFFKNQLESNNPVLLRIESKYGGHFVVINGYYERISSTSGELIRMVDIYDPASKYYSSDGISTDGRRVRWSDLLAGHFFDYNFAWTHTLLFYE